MILATNVAEASITVQGAAPECGDANVIWFEYIYISYYICIYYICILILNIYIYIS